MCIRPICSFQHLALAACAGVITSLAQAQCGHLGWSALGEGISGGTSPRVLALATFNDGLASGPTVYAGGEFLTAGTVSTSNIARWDGTNWHTVGAGVNGAVRAMTVFDDGSGNGPALYVGGDFTVAGEIPAQRIARWDGTTWSSIGDVSVGSVRAMTVFNDGTGDALYVAGTFEEVGGVAARNIAQWNGTGWSALSAGLGVPGESINALAVFDDGDGMRLHAGGSFSFAGSPRIAIWNGEEWSGLGGANAPVNALAAFEGGPLRGVFAGGTFTLIGGINARGLARWTGKEWLSTSVHFCDVLALAAYERGSTSALFIGKSADYCDGLPQALYRIDATSVQAVDLHHAIQSLMVANELGGTSLYVGGDLEVVSYSNPVRGIARFHSIASYIDCNRNRFDDSCDLAAASSADCNLDTIPDECQPAPTYQINDGPPHVSWGVAGGGDYLWLNRFTVQGHSQYIDVVALPWTPWASDGFPVEVVIYRDPNNDGDPQDALLVSQTTAESYFDDWFLPLATVRVPHVYVGGNGASFFAGAFTRSQAPIFAAIAGTAEPFSLRSWRRAAYYGTIDLQHPSSGGEIALVPERNWVIRAISMDCNGNGVWDQCDIDNGTSNDANANGVPDECEGTCAEDLPFLQGDGVVNLDDLLLVIDGWGPCPVGSCPVDITNDYIVNIDDLLAVINAWGPCQ